MRQTVRTKLLILSAAMSLTAFATPTLACRPLPLDDAYWRNSWTDSSRVALGRVVRVTPYSAAQLERLNEGNQVAPLQPGSGIAEVEVFRELKGAGPAIVRVQYQARPACWYRWSPAIGDTVMVFSGERTEAWPQERITLPRLRLFFDESQ